MGWKMIYLARRNPALAPEQFPQAWREHSALGAGCTELASEDLQHGQRIESLVVRNPFIG